MRARTISPVVVVGGVGIVVGFFGLSVSGVSTVSSVGWLVGVGVPFWISFCRGAAGLVPFVAVAVGIGSRAAPPVF